MSNSIGHSEIFIDEMWEDQLRVRLIFQDHRNRNAKTDLHLALVRWNRKALDQDAIATRSSNENGIAALLNHQANIIIGAFPA